jgi:F-type H+-transporting ATPase subunit b
MILRLTSLSALFATMLLAFVVLTAPVAAQHDDEPVFEENAEDTEELLEDTAVAGGHDDLESGEHGSEAHGEHASGLDYGRLMGQVVNFLLWAGIIYWLMKDRLPAFLASRRAGIVGELDEAKRMKEEAERKFAEYSERIENLDAELERMREQMTKGGHAERERIVADAAARGEKVRAEARFLVEQQMKQLREDLTREAVEAAVDAAEKILRERTAAPDQERLAAEYLERLTVQLKDGALKNETPSA